MWIILSCYGRQLVGQRPLLRYDNLSYRFLKVAAIGNLEFVVCKEYLMVFIFVQNLVGIDAAVLIVWKF